MSRRLAALLAGALALALIAAGCGGGDDSDTSASTLSKAELIEQGDAICSKGEKRVEAGFLALLKKGNIDLNAGPTEAQAADFAEKVLIPSVRREVRELRALGAPSGDEDEVEEILSAVEGAIAATEDDPAEVFNVKETPFAESDQLAKQYGFEVCGEE